MYVCQGANVFAKEGSGPHEPLQGVEAEGGLRRPPARRRGTRSPGQWRSPGGGSQIRKVRTVIQNQMGRLVTVEVTMTSFEIVDTEMKLEKGPRGGARRLA